MWTEEDDGWASYFQAIDDEERQLQEEQQMGLTAKQTGQEFEQPPEDTHLGICYMVIDLGIQEVDFQGQNKLQHKCMIGWELPQALMADGRPFVVSKEYTLSLNKKARLFQDLQSWRGRAFSEEELKAFDLFTVIGAPCQLSVIHHTSQSGSTWPRVEAVTKLMKGAEVPRLQNAPLKFSFEDGTKWPDSLPEWIVNKIAKAKYKSWAEVEDTQADAMDKAIDEARVSEEEMDDPIPF